MRAAAATLSARLRRFRDREDGASTLPAILFLPFFLMLMFSGVEMGVMILRQTMLERGVDMSVRILRLGIEAMPSHDTLKRSICNNVAFMPNCMTDLSVEIFEVDKATWVSTGAGTAVTCNDRSLVSQPVTTLDRGEPNQLMLMRACLRVDPMMPHTGLGAALHKDASGTFAMVVSTAFVNEPN